MLTAKTSSASVMRAPHGEQVPGSVSAVRCIIDYCTNAHMATYIDTPKSWTYIACTAHTMKPEVQLQHQRH